jgi:hypothetical protein
VISFFTALLPSQLNAILVSRTALPPTTLKTRKPIHRLTLSDLSAFPIWEYALDEEDVPGQDETWVRPLCDTAVPKGRWSLSVATDFATASGKSLRGFVGVTTAQHVEIDSAVILAGRRYVIVDSTRQARRKTASSLELALRELFPLHYQLRVLIRGEKTLRSGSVP